jgi:hypothetical protein
MNRVELLISLYVANSKKAQFYLFPRRRSELEAMRLQTLLDFAQIQG